MNDEIITTIQDENEEFYNQDSQENTIGKPLSNDHISEPIVRSYQGTTTQTSEQRIKGNPPLLHVPQANSISQSKSVGCAYSYLKNQNHHEAQRN